MRVNSRMAVRPRFYKLQGPERKKNDNTVPVDITDSMMEEELLSSEENIFINEKETYTAAEQKLSLSDSCGN